MKRTNLIVPLATSLFLLVACGGGGDDSTSITYNGVDTQAKITTENADDMIELAMEAKTEAVSTNTAIGVVTEDPEAGASRPYAILITRALAESVTELNPTLSTSLPGVVETISDTEICDNDVGSLSYSLTVDTDTGVFSGSMTFYNCLSEQIRLSGTVRVNGVINVDTLVFESITMSFDNFSATDGIESISMDGDMAFVYSGSTSTMRVNIVIQDDSTGVTIKLENYRIVITDFGADYYADISGRIYHPDYGYGTISTTNTLRFTYGDEWPYFGQFVIDGLDSSLRVTCINNLSYVREIDENGDGNYETVTTETW